MGTERRGWRAVRPRAWWGVAWIAAVVACGDGSGGGGSPPPDPYVPPAGGAPACELSADCPAGTYCDLGECYQACNVDVPCAEAELACSNRGRCQADPPGAADKEPPPETANDAEVAAAAADIVIDESDTAAMLLVAAEPAGADVRYRIEPRVSWLSIEHPRGTFRGSLGVTLAVDRTGLAPGEHAGVIVVHTTAGDVSVPVHLAQGITARYRGGVTYDSPRRFGTAPLSLDVTQTDGGEVALRVVADASPLLSLGGSQGLAAAATYADGRITATVAQRLESADFGDEQFWDRPVGRTLSLDLSATASGGLEGTFSETWYGLLVEPIEVTGTVLLARVGAVDTSISPDVVPTMPDAPDASPPPLTTACSDAAAAAALLPPGSCGAGAAAIERFSCGNAIRAKGAQLEDEDNGLVIDKPGFGYADFATNCAEDLADPLGTGVSQFPPQCVRPGNMDCARALFGGSSLDEALDGVGAVAADYAAVGTLLVNDALVRAFRTPYLASVDDAAVEAETVAALDGGRGNGREVLRRIFLPHVLDGMRRTPGYLADDTSHRALRRVAHLLGRYRLASDERARVLVRAAGATDRDRLRDDTAKEMTGLLVGLVVLGAIEQAQEAPPTPELGLFSGALTGLGKLYAQLGELPDPLGLPEGFVEFLYDPQMTGSGSTNYQQVLARHMIELQAAEAAEAAAQDAVRAFDTNADIVANELEQIDRQTADRLIALCGADPLDPTEPDVADCGTSTGEIASARADVDVELQNVHVATTRIEAHQARIAVNVERIDAIESVRGQTIEFVEATGDRLDALAYRDAQYARSQRLLSQGAGLMRFLGGIGSGNPLAAFSAGVDLWENVGASSIAALRDQIAIEREQLMRTQQLRIMEADYAVESIHLMTQLKELFIQTSELNEQLALAKLRLFAAGRRLQTLADQVRVVGAERDLLAGQVTARFANDPMFRVLRDRATADAIDKRERALVGIYKAARAFEFEINTPFPALLTDLVPAQRASQIADFATCTQSQFTDFRSVYGVPQTFVDEISLREDVLGIAGPITDQVTGAAVSEAEQFRRLLLQPTNRSRFGGVGFRFATTLSPGNGVFSTGVCNDQLRSVQVKLIGDGLGDDQARVRLEQAGASLMRSCDALRGDGDDVVRDYHLLPRSVEIQAGVNAYPSAPPDAQLFGRAVAASEWVLTIPPGNEAPTNADLNLAHIDDIVIRVEHDAISLSDAPLTFEPSCR